MNCQVKHQTCRRQIKSEIREICILGITDIAENCACPVSFLWLCGLKVGKDEIFTVFILQVQSKREKIRVKL